MENVKKINNNLAVATKKISVEQLQQAKAEEYKSVLNLRSRTNFFIAD